MSYQLSTTVVQMNGVPLLPPIITSDIHTEIQYYKQLAIAIEERLNILEVAKNDDLQKKEKINKDNIQVPARGQNIMTILRPESDNTIQNTTSTCGTVTNSTKDNSESLIEFDTSITENTQIESLVDKDNDISEPLQKTSEREHTLILDEDKSCLNDLFVGDSVSDIFSTSTDLNQYIHSTSTKTNTAETTPENWKPQVPKTLDIVPITVDKSKLPDKSNIADEETPKLKRSGSYTLDEPSPVLLACLQSKFASGQYTPTSDNKSLKRKEWSFSQIKADWGTQANFKEPSSASSNFVNKFRKGTNTPSQRVCKSVSNSKTGSPLDVYQPAKSVDCIQAMFAKECYSPKTASSRISNQTKKYSSPANAANGLRTRNNSKKLNKTTSALNQANKISGSLASMASNSPKPVKRIDNRNIKDSNLNKNMDQDLVKTSELNSQSNTQKPMIMSEKIVTVFKEIQDTHKKQMLELVSRQQKEQLLMQENFKKQQILLLAQIRKAFPEISISTLSEAITGKSLEHTTLNSKAESERSHSDLKMNGINNKEFYEQNTTKSHMDYSHSAKELSSTSCHLTIQPTTPTVTPYYQNDYQSTQSLDDTHPLLIGRAQLSNVRVIDDIPVGNQVRKHSSVSRQLFPLDSKTSHVSVLDNSVYTENHIKAATVINAYARGFLVRRLMKTEKVIALQNTYREALHCMLRLHVDAPLNLPEFNFHQRLQLQCDAASMNIVDLFSQSPVKRMDVIAHDREIKKARADRPSSARSFSFATQRTLARKKLKEMGLYQSLQSSMMSKSCPVRTRCQSWTSSLRERKITTSLISQGIKRSTSAGAVRRPWR